MPWLVDTSVVAKWFVQVGEKDLDQALAIRQWAARQPGNVLAPDFLWIELANVLLKGRKLQPEQVSLALSAVQQIGVVRLATDDSALAQAALVAEEFGTSVYDALFLAHARRVACGLVTADERLVKRFQGASDVRLLSLWQAPG